MDKTNKSASQRWANGHGHQGVREIKEDAKQQMGGDLIGKKHRYGTPDKRSLNPKPAQRAGKSCC
jgi:hypothetical protein